MESVGSPEEEGKLNTPVLTPCISPFYYSNPTFLAQVSNMAAKINLVSEMTVLKSRKMVQQRLSSGMIEVSTHVPL